MNKKQFFYKYTDFIFLQHQGAGWITAILRYFPISTWMTTAAATQILLWAFNINFPIYIVIIFLAMKYYAMMIINWLVGKYVIKIGLYRAQNQYLSKKKHLAPFNAELIAQLKAIGEKLGVKSKFTELDE